MIRMSIAALALAASASASLALAATDDELRQQILGAWGEDAECARGALTFNADGTCSIVMPGDDPETGAWTISNGVLTGSGQPTSTVTIDGDSLALGDPDGSARVERFTHCPG